MRKPGANVILRPHRGRRIPENLIEISCFVGIACRWLEMTFGKYYWNTAIIPENLIRVPELPPGSERWCRCADRRVDGHAQGVRFAVGIPFRSS